MTTTPYSAEQILDSDGENRVLRAFLLYYGTYDGKSIEGMRYHLKLSGFAGCWPDWTENATGHLTKMGAQNWIRHLIALEQQAAPGVAGELRWGGDSQEYQARHAQPHPTGDTQQAVGEVEWAGTGWTGSPNVQVKLHNKLPAGTKLFTHPPAATALAQEVKDRAVEICEWHRHEKERGLLQSNNMARMCATAISAIAIPEPRPDALVVMAYRRAAEVCSRMDDDEEIEYIAKDCAEAIKALTPPAAQAALEELVKSAVCAGADKQREICMKGTFGDGHLKHTEVDAIVRATLNQQNGKD